MPVGLLTLELHIPDAQSLKDKRQVLRSLKDKLRRQFNVAVAELDHHDVWQRSVVGRGDAFERRAAAAMPRSRSACTPPTGPTCLPSPPPCARCSAR